MSYPDWYSKVSAVFRSPASARALNILDKGLVALLAAAYIAMLVRLLVSVDARIWRVLLVPAATFAIVTLARIAIDKPRPYELHAIDPVIAKDTRGKSMPSRHVASAVIIACAFAWLDPLAGALAFVACAVVAFTRVIGGIHFPADVVAAIALSLACGLVGFVLATLPQ